jgi:ATP adenylyltransferase/5',5'''-P-1,P-4-tetraphosphate phosphorylase II
MINYQLPITNYVDLSVYNLLGQKVATLVNKRQQAGHYQIEWDATGFAGGVYYCRIKAGNFVQTRKMIYLK